MAVSAQPQRIAANQPGRYDAGQTDQEIGSAAHDIAAKHGPAIQVTTFCRLCRPGRSV